MGRFRVRRLVVVGALALSVAFGAAAFALVDELDIAFAQDDEFELDGVVEAMPATGMVGTWQISGRTVTVTEATEIDQEVATIAVGSLVEVEGTEQPDGSILASELEAEDDED